MPIYDLNGTFIIQRCKAGVGQQKTFIKYQVNVQSKLKAITNRQIVTSSRRSVLVVRKGVYETPVSRPKGERGA